VLGALGRVEVKLQLLLAWGLGSRFPEMLLQYPPRKGYYEVLQRRSTQLRLQELTQEQWGLITRQQAREAGIGSTTLERERLRASGGGRGTMLGKPRGFQ
jgi:hypothetical protein